MRIVIAGFLGGIAMFVWATIAHLATPLASAGLRPLPGGDAAIAQIQKQFGDASALYVFPAPGKTADQEAKSATGPSGLIAYQAAGATTFPRQLAVEFALEVAESILVGLLMAGAVGFAGRLRMAAAIGLVAAITTNVSYWNWYGFDTTYTLATGFIELVKYLVAGAVVAWWLSRHERQARAFTDMRFGRA